MQPHVPDSAVLTIGVISDTHGLLRAEALEALKGSAHIIHAGDVGDPSILDRLAAIAPVTAVRGNVDTAAWAGRLPLAEAVELGGRLFCMFPAWFAWFGRVSLTAEELDARRAAGESIAVVDVRSRREYEAGHVPGAVHLPFWRALFAPVPAAATLVLYCGHGPRAALAQTALRLRGVEHASLLGGHWSAWLRAGRPAERG